VLRTVTLYQKGSPAVATRGKRRSTSTFSASRQAATAATTNSATASANNWYRRESLVLSPNTMLVTSTVASSQPAPVSLPRSARSKR
jgi:hypothetical protein